MESQEMNGWQSAYMRGEASPGWQPEHMREQTELAKPWSEDLTAADMAMEHLQEYPLDGSTTYAAPRGTAPAWLKARIAERVLSGVGKMVDEGEVVAKAATSELGDTHA